MSRLERSILYPLAIIAVIIWCVVVYKLYQAWQTPLGPSMALPTLSAGEQASTQVALAGTAGPTSTLIPGQPTLTPYQVATNGAPLCGGPDVMTILAIGSDTRATSYLYGLSDVIRLVRIDFVTPRVNVLDFPRDLWVQIPDISSHYGIDHGKLNQAYLYGNPGMGYYDGPGQGPGLLARTLELNFGAHPDHYIAANMQTFVKLVDDVGGINIYLPYDVDGRKADQPNRMDLYFPAGPHHLNGEQALMLARIRQYTVFQRTDQQNHILCGLRDALLSPSNIPKLPKIIDAFDGAVQTDLSAQQISQLACLLPHLNSKNITFVSFPTDLLKGTSIYDKDMKQNVFIWDADFNTLRIFVSAFNTGIWPAPSSAVPPLVTSTPSLAGEEAQYSCP